MSAPGGAQRSDAVPATLQTKVDAQEHLIEELDLRLNLLEQHLAEQQQQLNALQTTVAAQKVTRIGANTALTGQTSSAETGQATASPTEIYLKAFGDYASGRYHQAIKGFETFLNHFPANNYAGNAQFWLGECYYKLGEYNRAVQEYRKVTDNYPLSGKAPEALLRMAPALRQLNQYEKARQALQTLQQRYPNSTAARKALVEP
jgi:tol-pal system protein YbgF